MAPPSTEPDPTDPFTVDPPPCRPPLELVEGGTQWVLEAYNKGLRDGKTYSVHDRQMDAMRAGKRLMDEDGHPCLLRWEADDSIGTIYWNPRFERLHVRYDPIMDTWVVVPEQGSVPLYLNDRQELAVRQAQNIQRTYNFKHLALHAENGTKRREIDHRFIRHELERSGVRFNREDLTEEQLDPLAEEESTEPAQPTSASPASALAAAVPDLTDIDVVFSEGAIHRYRAGWTDDEQALIDILDPDRCSNRELVDTFMLVVENWQALGDNQGIATVYDDGIGPSPWVAYQAGDGALVDHVEDLSLRQRLAVADDIANAYAMATLYDVPLRGARPENVRLDSFRGQRRARLADWGLSHAIARVEGERPVSHYTPPELLDGERIERTPVYQLGALTYFCIAKRPPYSGVKDLEASIRRGDPTPPSKVTGGPDELDDVVLQAMEPAPEDRYPRVEAFREALSEVVG